MKAVYWFNEIQKTDLGIEGGKGANLGELYNAGFPVPPGFVVCADAFFDFVNRAGINNLIKDRTQDLDYENSDSLEAASEEIKNAILRAPMSDDTRVQIVRAYNKMC